MSILNLGLQNCSLERGPDEDSFRSCSSMAQIRDLTGRKLELVTVWDASGSPVQKLIESRFQRLSLKEVPFVTKEPATDLERDTLKRHLRELFPELKNYGSLYLACNDRKAFFTSSDQSRYTLWSCQNVCDALSYLLDNIYIRFGTKLYRQIVGIPMGANCAPLVADLFLYCYERDFMDFLTMIIKLMLSRLLIPL